MPWLCALALCGCVGGGSERAGEEPLVEAGRRLFYDVRLSSDGETSCASCHAQQTGFADPRGVSVGAEGDELSRQAMVLDRAGQLGRLTWANPHLDSLEHQALIPLFTDTPIEMGGANRESEILDVISEDPRYAALHDAIWPDANGRWSWPHVLAALAAFQATIVSSDTAWDQFVAGDSHALTAAQQRGWQAFSEAGCVSCHVPPSFTDATVGPGREVPMHRIGTADGSERDLGLAEITHKAADRWRFRTPTLRHAPDTAPYLHDGSAPTLVAAIHAHDRVAPELSDETTRQIAAFLEALHDPIVQSAPEFSDPWQP